VYLLEFLRIDDPVGAVSVHGFAGIWGTLSLGLFASGQFGASTATGSDVSSTVTGLFYGGGWSVLGAQAIGSFTVTSATFAVSMLLMFAVSKLPYPFKLRVEAHGETGPGGIDVFEHGAEAYHN